MVFSTPCCTKWPSATRKARSALWLWCACAGWLACCLWTLPAAWAAAAQDAPTTPLSTELHLQRAEDGLYLSTNMALALPELVEDALYKGIPMFFVAEAQVVRDRWYWSNRQVAEATRYMRLSYQPLTRRWRLNLANAPFTNGGLGVALGQTFEEFDDVLAAIGRISRWKIAEAAAIDADAEHTVIFRFRLDMSQLPRPFQINAVGRSGWSLLVSRTQRLPSEAAK